MQISPASLFSLLFAAALLGTFLGCEPVTPENDASAAIKELIKQRDFIPAKAKFDAAKDKLSEGDALLIGGILENALFQTEASIQSFEKLLAERGKQLNDSTKSAVIALQIDNYLKAFRYADAAESCSELLGSFRHTLDSAAAMDFENMQRICEGLGPLPPQSMELHGAAVGSGAEIEIPYTVDQVNLKRIPVRNSRHASNFVFDTGANFSTITQTAADQLGVRPLADNIQVTASTGIQVDTRFGAADSLWIDSVLFQNVVFIVVPDADLTFPQINYQIEGIIGFPVITQMRRLTIDQQKKVIALHTGMPQTAEPNMYLNSLDLVLQADCAQGPLKLFLDTGAKYTDLAHPFFQKNEEWVKENGTLHSRTIGGAGGILEYDVYTLYDFPISLAGLELRLDSVDVGTMARDGKYYDGAVGQSTINLFDRMTIDFRNSRLSFE